MPKPKPGRGRRRGVPLSDSLHNMPYQTLEMGLPTRVRGPAQPACIASPFPSSDWLRANLICHFLKLSLLETCCCQLDLFGKPAWHASWKWRLSSEA
jgi:hypothetical protein